MMGKGLATVLLCVLLAGCFNGARKQIDGQKLGPGHCVAAGVVEVTVIAYHPGANGTLTLRIKNLLGEPLYGPSGGIQGSSSDKIHADFDTPGYKVIGSHRWDPPREHDWLEAHEEAISNWLVPDPPEGPWQELLVAYGYGHGNPTTMHCSLEGDNAPQAFVK